MLYKKLFKFIAFNILIKNKTIFNPFILLRLYDFWFVNKESYWSKSLYQIIKPFNCTCNTTLLFCTQGNII